MATTDAPLWDAPEALGCPALPAPGSRAQASCCGPGTLWGWAPPVQPADTPIKRLIDRLMPRTGLPVAAFYGAVIALLILGGNVPMRPGLALDALAALAAGGWCALNFWRCRQAHCALSGAGWLALSGFCLGEAVAGRSIIGGDEQLVFLGVLGVALAFEFAWYLPRGTNALELGAGRKTG